MPVTGVPGLDPVTLWEATRPILLGLVPAGLVWWQARSRAGGTWRRRAGSVPPGDVVVLAERVTVDGGQGLAGAGRALGAARDRGLDLVRSGWSRALGRARGPLGGLTRSAESYVGSGVLVLVLLVLVALVQGVGS